MLDNNEIWKDCIGYEGKYQISNYGRIWSVKSQKIMKPWSNGSYLQVVLVAKNGKKKIEKVHRLVALAFVPNPDNLPQVNHIDEDKMNNNADNLEWCTAEYNNSYGTRPERISKSKKGLKRPYITNEHKKKRVIQYTLDGDYVSEFSSLKEAREFTGISNISNCLTGRYKTAGGFIWNYA